MTTRPVYALLLCLAMLAGCDDDTPAAGGGAPATPEGSAGGPESPATPTPTTQNAGPLSDSLPNGLMLAYAQFDVDGGQVTSRPGPARLELLTRSGGEWHVEVVEDSRSNVFHKAMVYDPPNGEPGILTLGGMDATVKLWRRGASGWAAETLWAESFGGRWNRMRDAEIGDVFGDGKPTIAVGTHDQGVFAVIRQGGEGYDVTELDRQENTFIHEIELGDLNGDGVMEVYATPSEPNRLEGGAQHGEVVRYIPSAESGGERTIVADLGNRHAKEIYVGDVDGDGRDELYVAVEALTERTDQGVQLREPVEIRRYEHDTAPDAGVVIATIDDRLTRFLTVGDPTGDGKRVMVVAAFRSGLWLLEPGENPRGTWEIQNIDRRSAGFEHASTFADLDGDGTDELYVAADDQGELRRYLWTNGRPRRETIHSRELARSQMTWNITPVPVSLLAP